MNYNNFWVNVLKEDEWIDEKADISEDGMKWWSNNVNQTNCQIIESDLE